MVRYTVLAILLTAVTFYSLAPARGGPNCTPYRCRYSDPSKCLSGAVEELTQTRDADGCLALVVTTKSGRCLSPSLEASINGQRIESASSENLSDAGAGAGMKLTIQIQNAYLSANGGKEIQ